MNKWLLILILGCSGCSALFNTTKPVETPPIYEATDVSDGNLLEPQRTVAELLKLRLQICGETPEVRTHSEPYTYVGEVEPVQNPVDEQKLNALLLASCEPAKTPGVLNQLLAELTATGTWPEEYAAFFDLLIAGQKAYASVEKVYLDLEANFAALQEEHERTILGLGEIETQIEEQSQKTAAQ